MKSLRVGLRGELLLLMAGVLVVVVALFAALWVHERRGNDDARALSTDAVRALARDGMLGRGETLSSQLADAATNPLYYLDLAKLGELARATLRQPDVVYVIIHDAQRLHSSASRTARASCRSASSARPVAASVS